MARANTLLDERFIKEIKEIKEQAEQSFVGTLSRYHKRCLKNKKINTRRLSCTQKLAQLLVHLHLANAENIVTNDVNRVDKIEQDITKIKQLLLKANVLQISANNKNVEDYKQ